MDGLRRNIMLNFILGSLVFAIGALVGVSIYKVGNKDEPK